MATQSRNTFSGGALLGAGLLDAGATLLHRELGTRGEDRALWKRQPAWDFVGRDAPARQPRRLCALESPPRRAVVTAQQSTILVEKNYEQAR